MPNPEEMAVIGKLTKENDARVTEDSSTPLDEEELNPVCSDRLADLNLRPIPGVTPSANCVQRRKRQADNVPSDSTLYQQHMRRWSILLCINYVQLITRLIYPRIEIQDNAARSIVNIIINKYTTMMLAALSGLIRQCLYIAGRIKST